MIKPKRLFELFEVDWAIMRQNPGGRSAYLQRCLLGFAGTVNIDSVLDTSKKAQLKLKVGNTGVQVKNVSFLDANPSELTPTAAAAALEEAGFEDCVFRLDPETNRLQVKPLIEGDLVQIYGDLAAALQFGDCTIGEGKGCYLVPSFDGDLKSVAETEEWTEGKKIENESLLGTPVTYTTAGKRSGTQIVITDRLASREVKQMINGGVWTPGDSNKPETYEPPSADDSKTRKVDVFTYSKILDKTTNTEGDEKYIRERMYIGGIGSMKRTGGAGSFSDSEYTLTFGSYKGEDGKEHSSPKETDYTIDQWVSMSLQAGIIEPDWENA